MSQDRARILGRLRHALANPDLKFPPPAPPALAAEERIPVTRLETGSRALRFQEELQALHGTCEIADSGVTARMQIVRKVAEWRALPGDAPGPPEGRTRVMVWPELDELVPGLTDSLAGQDCELVVPADLAAAEIRADLARIAIGITGVDAAFAATGSVLLKSGPRHSRVASLLPLRHLALIPEARLWDNVEQWLAEVAQDHALRNSANATLVSGPSKSADIESRLTWGVHGPMNLHAVIVPS